MRVGRHTRHGRKASAVLEVREESLPHSRSPITKAERDSARPLAAFDLQPTQSEQRAGTLRRIVLGVHGAPQV